MATHIVHPEKGKVHGYFDRDLDPILQIDSGDTVVLSTLDAGWGALVQEESGVPAPEVGRDREVDTGHALAGPIAVRGAEPGDILEVRIVDVLPGKFGRTWAGQLVPLHDSLGIEEELAPSWRLDTEAATATTTSGGESIAVPLRPFMGVMGNAPAERGRHATRPPRSVGGNIDCRELVAGSTLWVPVAVASALFSVGDGHAAQGDGEVSGTAIECPMDRVELRFFVCTNLRFDLPRAVTPAGYVTFGFGATLEEASEAALAGMLDHLEGEHGLGKSEAIALASVCVDLRVTQIVNETVGVHAVLPRGAIGLPGTGLRA